MTFYAKFNKQDHQVTVYDFGYPQNTPNNPVFWIGGEVKNIRDFRHKVLAYLLGQDSNPSRTVTILAEPKLGGGGWLAFSAIGVRNPEFRLLLSVEGAGNSNNWPAVIFKAVKFQYIVLNPSPQGMLQQIQFTFEKFSYENL